MATPPEKTLYEFGPFRLDPAKRRLLRDGAAVMIQPKALEMLLALVERRGQVVGKDELQDLLWPDTVVEENNLTVNMSVLRKALGESAQEHRYIVTVPGRGYCFVADVRPVLHDAAEGEAELLVQQTAKVSVVVDEEEQDEGVRGVEPVSVELGRAAAVRRGEGARSPAEPLVSRIKRHQLGLSLTLAAIVVAAAATFFYLHRAPALTEKDTILLADFVNTTGDAVFDGTLKQGLAVQLEQSPFLNIFSDQRVRETLRYMDRSPDERVTPEMAREICERQGLKAMLAGSIARLGSHYVLTLEAVNAQTGDTLARQQVEAASKEQVLGALGQAATKLREKLGESLNSIRKFDAPVEQATTASLEALKAYSLGIEQANKGLYLIAAPLFKKAIEIDPNFALAYADLASALTAILQRDEAAAAATRAFELRERVSEREKYRIAIVYYTNSATGDIESLINEAELWKRTYPRAATPRGYLAVNYIQLGQFEQAAAEAREVIRLSPNVVGGYMQLGQALTRLNRFDEARAVYQQAMAHKLDSRAVRYGLFHLALVQGDAAAVQQQIEWTQGRPEEFEGLHWQAVRSLFFGQLRQARALNQRASEMARHRNLTEVPADFASIYAHYDAFIGSCRYVRQDVATTLAVSHSYQSLTRSALSLALCGEVAQAESLAGELNSRYPKHTVVNVIQLPAVRAAIELRRGNPEKAVETLQSVSRYAPGSYLFHPYLLGLAYLNQNKNQEAAAEFQKILDHRGQSPTSPIYALAHVGLARASARAGEVAKARRAYEDFFALWKEADADLPVLVEAKREYEQMK